MQLARTGKPKTLRLVVVVEESDKVSTCFTVRGKDIFLDLFAVFEHSREIGGAFAKAFLHPWHREEKKIDEGSLFTHKRRCRGGIYPPAKDNFNFFFLYLAAGKRK